MPLLKKNENVINNNAITNKVEARRAIARRHPEYLDYAATTRWILDTLEGGDRYRNESYGVDSFGKPVRNLLRLPRELPFDSIVTGSSSVLMNESMLVQTNELGETIGTMRNPFQGNPFPFVPNTAEAQGLRDASDEIYDIRRQRTPVPNFLSNFIEKQLAKIYKRPISREGGDDVMAWCDNIDGRETSMDEWMRETIAPLLCAIGMIDIAFDHPMMSEGEPPILGRDTDLASQCVASFYLPENVLNWELDYTKRYYLEVWLQEWEWDEDANGGKGAYVDLYRHWTYEDWTLYNKDGEVINGGFHSFGVCPVVRVFDRRNFRMDHASLCRMYPVADLSRAYYNEESEMIASLTLHNCPILEGPADDSPADDADDTVPIGRNLMLRKVTDRAGNQVGYGYVEPKTDAFEFVRLRLSDLQTRMESQVALTKSVGSVGIGGSQAVAQSGISKAFDQAEGSDYLASFAKTLQIADYTICYFASIVLFDGSLPDGYMDSLSVTYPSEFNLLSFTDVALIDETIQAHMTNPAFGMVPTADKEALRMMYRKQFPDMTKDLLEKIDEEIDQSVDEAAKKRQDDLKHVAEVKAATLENLKNPAPQVAPVRPDQPGASPPVPLPKATLPPPPKVGNIGGAK